MSTTENGEVKRGDGTVIYGLTDSKWKEYKKMYKALSDLELIHIIDSYGSFDKHNFELRAGCLDAERKHEMKYGKPASFATSLFMLLSVHVKPRKSSSLSVFGEISTVYGDHAKECYIYKRESQNAEIISGSDDGGYLTLNGPSLSCSPDQVYSLLQTRELSIRLFDGQGQSLYVNDDILLDYSVDVCERVKNMEFQTNEMTLTLKYVSIPMAIYGRVDVKVFWRKGFENSSDSVDVHGEVVATYKNALGNYDSEEIVLFDKKCHEYQRVPVKMLRNSLPLQRVWVAAPAYSLLHLRIDLSSREKSLLTENVELDYSERSKEFISGEYLISVSSTWFNTSQPPGLNGHRPQISRSLEQWAQEPAIEVFSVLVCYDKDTPLQIQGRLQCNTSFVSEDFIGKGFEIFKREDEVPLTLLGGCYTIPLLNDGSRILCNYFPVSLICDLQDTIVGLNIKGYQTIKEGGCLDRQLCSVFRGGRGFVAVHFSIFRFSVQAHLEVFVYHKGSQCAVSGSICARYEGFIYPSQYEENCYSIVCFKKGREELVPMDADGSTALSKFSIPLSRTSFLVPTNSSFRLHLDLKIGTEDVKTNIKVVPNARTRSIKVKECKLQFVFKWSEVM